MATPNGTQNTVYDPAIPHDWFFRFLVLSTNIMSSISTLKLHGNAPSLNSHSQNKNERFIPGL